MCKCCNICKIKIQKEFELNLSPQAKSKNNKGKYANYIYQRRWERYQLIELLNKIEKNKLILLLQNIHCSDIMN